MKSRILPRMMFARMNSYRSILTNSLEYSVSNLSCTNTNLCSKKMSLSSSSSGARAVFPSRASVHPDPHGGENYEPGNQSTGSWIHQLPLWLKSLALGSILLLTFSIIFVSVAAVLTANLEVPRGNVDAVGTSRRTLGEDNKYQWIVNIKHIYVNERFLQHLRNHS